MNQYQRGDQVVVRSDLVVGEHYKMESGLCGDSFVEEMSHLRGCIVTIISSTDKYLIKECGYNWTDEMFEGFAMDLGDSIKLDQSEFLNLL